MGIKCGPLLGSPIFVQKRAGHPRESTEKSARIWLIAELRMRIRAVYSGVTPRIVEIGTESDASREFWPASADAAFISPPQKRPIE
jgi:hypothetical protein